MAVHCARCGSFNPGQQQACISCMGPLANGQSVPSDVKWPNHPGEIPLVKCASCGTTVCFEDGSLIDNKVLCFNCAPQMATTTATSAADAPKAKKRGLSLGKKK